MVLKFALFFSRDKNVREALTLDRFQLHRLLAMIKSDSKILFINLIEEN